MGASHPELTQRTDYMLAGILRRLGLLLEGLGISDPVSDVTPLSEEYLGELFHFAMAKAKDIKEAAEAPDA